MREEAPPRWMKSNRSVADLDGKVILAGFDDCSMHEGLIRARSNSSNGTVAVDLLFSACENKVHWIDHRFSLSAEQIGKIVPTVDPDYAFCFAGVLRPDPESP